MTLEVPKLACRHNIKKSEFGCPTCADDDYRVHVGSEMDLRDWFAGQALVMVLNMTNPSLVSPGGIAEQAYAIAKAMLEERTRRS